MYVYSYTSKHANTLILPGPSWFLFPSYSWLHTPLEVFLTIILPFAVLLSLRPRCSEAHWLRIAALHNTGAVC